MAKSNIDIKELKEIGISGGFSDAIREAVVALKSMDKAYDSIINKIDSMNKGTINTKKINDELNKANKKSSAANKAYWDAVDEATADAITQKKDYIDAIKAAEEQEKQFRLTTQTGIAADIAIQKQLLEDRYAELDLARKGLKIEAVNLLALEETARISAKITDEVKDRYLAEQQLEKQLGFTANVLKIVSKNTGLFKDAFAEVVEKARDGKDISKWVVAQAIGAIALKKAWDGVKYVFLTTIDLMKKGIASLVPEGAKNPLSGMFDTVSNLMNDIPYLGKVFGPLVDALNSALSIILHVDNTIVKAGRSLNMNTQQARQLYDQYQKVAAVSGDTFITSQKLLQSRVDLGTELGVNNSISEANLKTDTKLRDIAGIELETRARILENSIIAGQNSEDLVKNIFAQVKGLENATGISLNYQKVLKEANSLGGYLGLAFAKYPEKLTKSLVTTQALGMSLKELDGIANSFLDFESSIASEFEAQLLTGKELNLQTARRLFLQNDLAGAALEINKQVGSSEEYLNMNRIAAESLAKTFGMTRDTLGDMLKKQEFLSRIGAKDTDNARQQLRIALERYRTQEDLVEAIGEEAYMNMVNASTQERIGAFLDKVKTTFIDFIESSGLIQKVEGFIKYLSSPENMQKMISSVKNIVARAVEVIGNLTYYILNALDYMSFGYAIDESFLDSIKRGTAEAAMQIRGSDIGTAMTVSGNMVNAARSQGSMASNSGQSTIINNYGPRETVVEWKTEDSTIGRVAIREAQSEPIAGNTSNRAMSFKNNSITGTA